VDAVTLNSQRSADDHDRPSAETWQAFVWLAVILALTAGFGLGGALFAAPLLGVPTSAWWPSAAQAHAHVQLFGWGGLMVLGVGFHFLPRLRGRSLAHPERARLVLILLGAGLVLRAISQPLLDLTDTPAWRTALVLSGVLELAGLTTALGMLAQTLAGAPPVRSRAGLWQVVPFLATAFAAFWLALLVNVLGTTIAALGGASRVPDWADSLQNLLGLYGFLVPISMGMGVRVFPLHFGARLPGLPLLRAGLAALLAGLGLRVTGSLAGIPVVTSAGLAASAAALALFVAGTHVFARRRAIPGARRPWFGEPAQWLGLSAFAWLTLDALLLVVAAFAPLLPATGSVPLRAEWHILGTGFVSLLIFGEGVNLLPGFGGRPLRSEGLVWATLALGNLATVLRVGPVLLPAVFSDPHGRWALAASGLLGLLAVALFAANLTGARSVRTPGVR
jgi:uncharacterized protein involved in response to NO